MMRKEAFLSHHPWRSSDYGLIRTSLWGAIGTFYDFSALVQTWKGDKMMKKSVIIGNNG
jgi:hypothetical protein